MTSSPPDVPSPRDSGDLLVSVRWRGPAAVVTVAGEIDLVTAPELDEVVSGAVDESPDVLVVDLRGVTFLSSAGLQVLAAAHQRLGEQRLRVVTTSNATSRPLTSTGLDAWIGLFPTVDEALSGALGTGA
ncbi:STAS domain-containing protein [Amycolatopsis sp. FDAARGOS 1241]|uniref:STAS domain-containing protein n=1 Tax=Amycolatopsis sp. FDAARGOS 1241 TaxID=2778070 RepID=UPI00194DBEB3|nr:STAS domain-containing protein [Amycolatopsis sp. FDAARGOS 1241]QRP43599.1 STAS domain-containing protein [Amycolatopsis sp. FDAARGOS 1241]